MICSEFAMENWLPVDFPPEYDQLVKLPNSCQVGGRLYVMPQAAKVSELGYVVGYGDTMAEAIRMAKEVADAVDAYYVKVDSSALDQAEGEIEKAREIGVWAD